MHVKRSLLAIGLGIIIVACAGCPPKAKPVEDVQKPFDFNTPVPPGQVALYKLTDPREFPDFSEGFEHKAGLEQSVNYSLEYLSKKSSELYFPYLDINHDRAVRSCHAFLDVLKTSSSPQDFDQKVKAQFDIYKSRGSQDTGRVLFTGYYCPIFDCRLQSDSVFKYPLYRKPPDLVYNESTSMYQRMTGGPFYTRGEINRGAINGKGLELCYLRDQFEVYIVTVQGSGKLRKADGTMLEIGYAGDNGYNYTSIGQDLVNRGVIKPEELSLDGLIDFFRRNPQELTVLDKNQRYVFFTERPGGPFGCLNVPVTPFYSIATDKSIYPRAGVAYMMNILPARDGSGAIQKYKYAGFACDQDRGNAIRAAGRCDVFLGTGKEVGQLAGRTYDEGKLYYIYVK